LVAAFPRRATGPQRGGSVASGAPWVVQELTRPVFSLLGSKPLSEVCTFIAYDALVELSKEKNLEYLRPAVLDEYAEQAEVY
jgi:hypothetical protein